MPSGTPITRLISKEQDPISAIFRTTCFIPPRVATERSLVQITTSDPRDSEWVTPAAQVLSPISGDFGLQAGPTGQLSMDFE